MAEGNFKLLVEAQNAIDLKGPNATMLGDKAQGSASASGKAIIASQQGGMISLGDLTDHLRHLDKRVFRAIWNRIRQYWTAEKWIRTTDDERNVKWVALNVDPMRLQMADAAEPGRSAQRVAGAVRQRCRAGLRHHHRRGAGQPDAAARAIPGAGRTEEDGRERRDSVPRHRRSDPQSEEPQKFLEHMDQAPAAATTATGTDQDADRGQVKQQTAEHRRATGAAEAGNCD